nr:hypothetical transcript [Hymenolepis microstoma]
MICNPDRYMSVSREGSVVTYNSDMHLLSAYKITTDLCKPRDLWVADVVALANLNKLACFLSTKEILFAKLDLKLELAIPIKMVDLPSAPLCADYWHNPENKHEFFLIWGDVDGYINIIFWKNAQTNLFEYPKNIPQDKEDSTIIVNYQTVMTESALAALKRFKAHDDWVRQVQYIPQLDCIISCCTQRKKTIAISWLEKPSQLSELAQEEAFARNLSHISNIEVNQGVNAFDYHSGLSLIAMAGNNCQIALWNPHVTSRPNAILRGHTTPVIAVHFQKDRPRLISFSKGSELRVWDLQLQVCIQKLNGIYPKRIEASINTLRTQICYNTLFHEEKSRLFIAFNGILTVMEMKPDNKHRSITHNSPVVGVVYNPVYNQIITIGQHGKMAFWMVESGKHIKSVPRCHGDAEITCLVQDEASSRLYTGSTNGNVKVWDMNGHCLHTLVCKQNAFLDVSGIVVLKRGVIVIGGGKHFIVFRMTNFNDHFVYPSDWKCSSQHKDDVMAGCSLPPHGLVTGSYDGELIIWSINTESVSRRMNLPSSNSADRFTDMQTKISQVLLLDARTMIKPGNRRGANLVSCGGNGSIHFWNAYECILIGAFVAHPRVRGLIMAVDPSNETLATADVEGNVKLWNISSYSLFSGEEECMYSPPIISQWIAHSDQITGLVFCVRFEKRTVIATSSSDFSVCLWSLEGHRLGVFGQPERWKLDAYMRDMTTVSTVSQEMKTPSSEEKDGEDDSRNAHPELEDDDDDPFLNLPRQDLSFGIKAVLGDGKIQSDDDPDHIKTRLEVWEKSVLGEKYQEIRLEKPMRRQPRTLGNMPFLYADNLEHPKYGPYFSLEMKLPEKLKDLQMPEFITNPLKYFGNKEDLLGAEAISAHSKLPLVDKYVREQLDSNGSESSLKPLLADKYSLLKHQTNYDKHLSQNNQNVGSPILLTTEKSLLLNSNKDDKHLWQMAGKKPNSMQRIPEIHKYDEKYQRLKSNVWLRMSWSDYRLAWNPSEFAGIESINIAIHKLWKPEIVVLNNVDGEFEATFKPNVVLQSDGHVLWIPPIIYKTSCAIDVKYFPFDEQTCRMELGSWTYIKDQVELQFYNNQTNIDLSDYVPSGVWDFIEGPGYFHTDETPVYDEQLKTSSLYRHGSISNRPPTSRITFKIVLRRKSLFYITNIIIPCVLIALLGICVFCLPTDAGEKVTLSISILVTIVVYMILVSKMLPAGTKSIPLLSKFLLFTFAMTFLSLCITVAVIINLNHRNPKSHPKISKWVRRVFMQWLPSVLRLQRKVETKEEENSASDTDESKENIMNNKIRGIGSTSCNCTKCCALENFVRISITYAFIRKS